MSRALITGITGQDGSYLAELLLARGDEVHGLVRRPGGLHAPWARALAARCTLHVGDMGDGGGLTRLVAEVAPDAIYNLAGQSHVGISFTMPAHTCDVVASGTLRLLEAARAAGGTARFYQASSSEMFGAAPAPQGESTPLSPRSPYACAKVCAHFATGNYREAYGMFACSGILFNHESPRRGESFVTRKVTLALPRLLTGAQATLALGNLAARRDWGHARDYMDAVVRICAQDAPDDFVIGTGIDHSVEDFVAAAFALVDLDWRRFVIIDPRLLRPAEVPALRADPRRAEVALGWRPTTSFAALVEEMVVADLAAHGLTLAAARALGRTR